MNNIGAEGAGMISESLKSNKSLTKLDLRCDEMNNGKEVNEDDDDKCKEYEQLTKLEMKELEW